MTPHRLVVLSDVLAICRLDAGADPPTWAFSRAGDLRAVVGTAEELSVVCPEEDVPPGVRHDGGWRGLKVAGPIDLREVGVLAGLAEALASAGIAVFALSTFDTDYLLVKGDKLAAAVDALRGQGYAVDPGGTEGPR